MAAGNFFEELKRRRVIRVLIGYAVAVFVVLQIADLVVGPLGLPDWTTKLLIVLAAAGFPIAITLAWAFDVTPDGVKRTPSRRQRKSAAAEPAASSGASRFTVNRIAVVGAVAVLAGAGAAAVFSGGGDETANRVVVLPFENLTGNPSLDPLSKMASDWISRGLTETQIAEVADALSANVKVSGDANALRELADRAGAGIAVSGSYYLQRDSLLVVARITDLRKGKVQHEIGPVRTVPNDPVSALESLRAMVSGAFAADRTDNFMASQVKAPQPPRYDAYRAYLDGGAAFEAGDFPRAVEQFRRALTLDSTYMAAAVRLAYAYTNLGDYARVDSVGSELSVRQERLSEYERHYLARVMAWNRSDFGAAYTAALRMKETAPGSDAAAYVAARSATRVGRVAEAVDGLKALDPKRGYVATVPVYWNDLPDNLHYLGRDKEAVKAAERGRAQHSGALRRPGMGLPSLAMLKDQKQLDARIEEARVNPPFSNSGAAAIAAIIANELLWHGEAELARHYAVRAVELMRPAIKQATAAQRGEFAYALIRAGMVDEANAVVDSLLQADSSSVQPLYLKAALFATKKDAAAAERLLRKVEAVRGPYRPGDHNIRAAWVLSLLGRKDEAVRLLQQSPGPDLPSLHGNRLHLLVGYPAFDELVRPRK